MSGSGRGGVTEPPRLCDVIDAFLFQDYWNASTCTRMNIGHSVTRSLLFTVGMMNENFIRLVSPPPVSTISSTRNPSTPASPAPGYWHRVVWVSRNLPVRETRLHCVLWTASGPD
ncbi:hypothetical protein J6590_030914 [Homalodisca vitripennis]|nr:hypothetical protein J6590_030914 [Homalodisca vitripennis]